MITATPHTHCRACGEQLPVAFLDLGMQPLANNLCTENKHCDDVFPMRLCRCGTCGLLQLDTVIDPTAMFSHYLYTPSQSKKTLAHFEELADTATKRPPMGLAVDIGSNDGVLLGMLRARGWDVCGIDPAENLALEAIAKGLPTLISFFDTDTVTQIRRKYGPARLITANNVFAHTPSWPLFVENVSELLAPDGLLALEFPYGPTMLGDGTFDLIYWEHCSFPSLTPIAHAFNRYDLHVQDVEYLPDVHGGSMRVWIGFDKKSTKLVEETLIAEEVTGSINACKLFTERVEQTKRSLQMVVHACERVVGFTAPAKCVTLLIAAGLGASDIAYIIDDNPLKQGRMLPKLHIPIIAPHDASLVAGDTAIIFAWNVAEDIMSKLPDGVDVIIPMPHVRIVRR